MEAGRIISGTWRFKKSVTREALVKAAEEFANGPNGHKFLDLHVRGASNTEHYIGVKFVLEEDSEKAHDKFFFWMRDELFKRFAHGLKGWSLSTPTVIVKLVPAP